MFGKRLKLLRERNGKSQQEVAEAINVARATISRYESGLRDKPTLPRLKGLSDYFGVSIDFLTGESDNMYPKYSNDTIINLFNELPEEKRDKAISYIKYLLESDVDGND